MEIKEIRTIEDGGSDDLFSLLDEQMRCIGAPKPGPVLRSSIENALRADSRSLFFLVFDPDRAIGVAFLNLCSGIESEGDYVWLNEIHITESHRNRGVGRMLLRHIADWARRHKCTRMVGVTARENSASRELFRSEGFRVSDVEWVSLDL
jgi:GNAT superfamily N-acetyltransferase